MFGVAGWNVWFYGDIANLKAVWDYEHNTSSITKLYLDFLKYYSGFDFVRDTITIRTLEPMPRSLKRWNACRIAIEDPFELTWNLGSRVDDRMACFIQKLVYLDMSKTHLSVADCVYSNYYLDVVYLNLFN